MKELSIEERAQRYDEIIEGIQEILSSGQDSIKMSRLRLRLQGIFPELREEFEDEIKKACEYWYQYNRDIVKRHGAKAVLGCGEFTVNVEGFRKYLEG